MLLVFDRDSVREGVGLVISYGVIYQSSLLQLVVMLGDR